MAVRNSMEAQPLTPPVSPGKKETSLSKIVHFLSKKISPESSPSTRDRSFSVGFSDITSKAKKRMSTLFSSSESDKKAEKVSSKETSISPSKMEDSKNKHLSQPSKMNSEELLKEFFINDLLEQMKLIFEINLLNEKQKELKVHALAKVNHQLENSEMKIDRRKLFLEMQKWIFSSGAEDPKFVNQCFDILLGFSLSNTEASLLCEFSSELEENNLQKLTLYIYSQHSEKNISLKDTVTLFTIHDLKGTNMQTLFRRKSLSSKLLCVYMEFNLSHELSDLVSLLNEEVKNPKKYYDSKNQCFTNAGNGMISECLDKILMLKLESSREVIKLRCELIAEHFKDAKDAKESQIKKAKLIGIREMLFLRGINSYIMKHVHQKNDDLPAKAIITKFCKVLQSLANQHLYGESTPDASLNILISNYQKKMNSFIESFLT